MGGIFHDWRHPRRCYMVCAVARTGSNLLTDGLHATRRAGRPKQFFLPKFEADYGEKQGVDPAEDFAGYVRAVVEQTSTSNEVFGFKVMGWYLDEFLSRLRRTKAFGDENTGDLPLLENAFPRLKFVQIVRGNKLLQAISKARAIQSGLWKVQEGNRAISEPHFDADLITQCLDESKKGDGIWEAFFQKISVKPHVVVYEKLCQDYSGTIQAVLDYLKIRLPRDSQIPPPKTVRQIDSQSLEWEKRYVELHPSAQQFVTA